MEKNSSPKKGLRKASAKKKSVRDTRYSSPQKEIITPEELKRRHGITGNKKEHILAYVRTYMAGKLFHDYAYSLVGLAKYIFDKKELYVTKHNGYKLMEFSSIHTLVRIFHKEEVIREEEEKQKKKAKMEYHSRRYY